MIHYLKAPITEAIIDIQVRASDAPSSSDLADLAVQEGGTYPDKTPLLVASVKVENIDLPDAGMTAETSKSQRGWMFLREDKRQAWQARRDGFSLSRLAPYESWEPFRDEARRLWNLTKSLLGPDAVTRIAVRYINRLELPLPLRDFKDYLRTVPEVSPALPQGLSAFFMQLQIPQEDLRALLVINESLAPMTRPDSIPVIMDLDIFRTDNVPQDEESLWDFLEQLHTRKNEAFEGCITDLTRELIS